MHVQCPHCHHPIELVETPAPREVVCSVCGSSINLDPGRTRTLTPGGTHGRIDRFELLDVLGVGAHGTVYKARDTDLDRLVAVKVPRVTCLPSQDDVDRFLRESRSTAQLEHPGIVSLYDAGQVDGTCYLVSEYVQGATLADRLTSGPLEFRQAAALMAEVADALHYAHQQGIVHRDLKPSNIMLDLQDRPHLMDFGLAKREAGEITMTLDGQILGTPAYMSPEQARGESHRVDARSDLYSLGVILYELLTGELPFRGNTRMLIVQVLRDEPRPPRSVNDRIPKDLETICLKAMAKEPGLRYSQAGEFRDDLRRWLRGEPVQARPVGPVVKMWRWCRRNPTVAGLTAAVATLLAAVAFAASVAAVNQGRMADRERGLRSAAETAKLDAEAALQRADQAQQRVVAAHKQAILARDDEAAARARAEAFARRNRLGLYAARVSLAQQAWEAADIAHARELLASQIPAPHEDDLRGFEWYYLWQLCYGERLTIRADLAAVRAVAFSPDGTMLATVSGDVIRLWDVASGRPHASYPLRTEARCVAFSPDGRILAAGGGAAGEKGRVKLWNVSTRREQAVFGDFDDPVVALAFAADGKTLATGTTPLAPGWGNPLSRLVWAAATAKPAQIKLWDVEQAKVRTICEGQTGGILSLAFSPDGKTLASGGWDATVRLWDTDTGRPQGSHKQFTSYVWSVVFAANGDLFAGGGKWDGQPELNVWRRDSGTATIPSTHRAGITGIAVSPDGKTLATSSWDRTVQIRDATTGEVLRTIKGHTSYVSSLSFSPDGEYLATAGWDGTVKLWFTKAQLDQTTFDGWETGGYCLSFSPDGQWLANSSSDAVNVWDLASAEVRVTLPGHTQTLVAFSPDGHQLATTGMDGIIRLYDTATWQERRAIAGHSGTIWAMAYSSDGQVLATGSQDATAKLWSAASGQELATLDGGLGGTVRSVAFSPDGKQLAAAVHVQGESKSMVKVWDVETGELQVVRDAHRHNIECVVFSPDGTTLATTSHDTTALLWDTETWQPRATLKGHIEPIYHAAFSPDGKTLATASWDGTIGLWHVATGEPLASLTGHAGTVWNVVFARNGSTLASASSYQESWRGDFRRVHEVKLWHAAAADKVRVQSRLLTADEGTWRAMLRGHGAAVKAVAEAGDLLASGDATGTLMLWNLADGEERTRIAAHSERIADLDVSPHRDLAATASSDGSVKLWQIPSGRLERTLREPSGQAASVAFAPDGTTLATGSLDEPSTILWDTTTGDQVAELSGHTVSCLAFSPEGKFLATGSWAPTRVQIWDLATRQIRHTLTGHQWGITCVAWSPDRKMVAAGGGFGDPTIRLWNSDTGQEEAVLVGHADETTSLAFSPDGMWLVTASFDRTLKIWNLATREEHGTVFGHPQSILDVAFAASGTELVTASSDQALRIWDWSRLASEAVTLPKPASVRIPVPEEPIADLQKLYHQAQWEELAQAADEVAQVRPNDKAVFRYLGEARMRLGNHAQAFAAFQRHLELCPNCRLARHRLATCHIALGSHADAAELLEQLVHTDADDASAYNRLAWLYATGPDDVRDPPRAAELAQRAVEWEPENASFLNTLGVAHYRAGQFQKAVDALSRAVAAHPDEPSPYDLLFLAMSFHRLGERDQAARYYDQALQGRQTRSGSPDDAEWEAFRAEAAALLSAD